MGLWSSYRDTILRAGDTRDTRDTVEQGASVVHTLGPRSRDTPGPWQCLGPRAFPHYRGGSRARRPYRYMNTLNTRPPSVSRVSSAMDNLSITPSLPPTTPSL